MQLSIIFIYSGMWLYILIILFIAYLAFQELNGAQLSKSGLMFALGGLCLFVGLGDMLGGYDRYIYANLFDELSDQIMHNDYNFWKTNLFDMYMSDMGYCWLNVAIGFITRNRYIFILLVTMIIYINIYNAIKKYTNNYALALLVFMGFWFFFTFTYLRQVLAVSFAWYAIKYILQRNWRMYLVVMTVAILFHNSAFVFAPLYFVPVRKYKRNMVLGIAIVCLLIGLTGIPSLIYDAYDDVAEYAGVKTSYTNEDNARWAYIVEAVLILFIIHRNYNILFENKLKTLMTNTSIIFCMILMLFYNSENGGRMSWYYVIGIVATLSNLVGMASKNMLFNRHFIIILCLCLYLRIMLAWGIQIYPYKTFLTPGIREGDIIEMTYEYDHDYDENKFYR